jgi:hypothetical protein
MIKRVKLKAISTLLGMAFFMIPAKKLILHTSKAPDKNNQRRINE